MVQQLPQPGRVCQSPLSHLHCIVTFRSKPYVFLREPHHIRPKGRCVYLCLIRCFLQYVHKALQVVNPLLEGVLLPGASVLSYTTSSTQLSCMRCVLPSIRHLIGSAHCLYHFVFPCPMMDSDTTWIFTHAFGNIAQHTWGLVHGVCDLQLGHLLPFWCIVCYRPITHGCLLNHHQCRPNVHGDLQGPTGVTENAGGSWM